MAIPRVIPRLIVSATPFLAIVPAVIAIAAALARWAIQSSGNLYTALDKRFYVPDRDVGWRVAGDGPIWLGLEVIGGMAAFAVGIAVAAWVIRRVERKRGGTPWRWARIATWIAACVPIVVPIAAFATGLGPDGGRESLPQGQLAAAPTSGIEGDLGRPGGRYEVIAHEGSAITARVSAGEEVFDARFAGDLRGTWDGDPRDLTRPMTAEIDVAAASVDTGIAQRSRHAREGYLYADKHPRIGFALRRLIAARQDAPDLVLFRAEGSIAMMGLDHAVEVTGSLRALPPDGAARLGLANRAVLIVQADMLLKISQSALAADRDSFDSDDIPIHVSLVLAHRNNATAGVNR
jgi:hypothetical protein